MARIHINPQRIVPNPELAEVQPVQSITGLKDIAVNKETTEVKPNTVSRNGRLICQCGTCYKCKSRKQMQEWRARQR
jgi:hypothetical protein